MSEREQVQCRCGHDLPDHNSEGTQAPCGGLRFAFNTESGTVTANRPCRCGGFVAR